MLSSDDNILSKVNEYNYGSLSSELLQTDIKRSQEDNQRVSVTHLRSLLRVHHWFSHDKSHEGDAQVGCYLLSL